MYKYKKVGIFVLFVEKMQWAESIWNPEKSICTKIPGDYKGNTIQNRVNTVRLRI